MQQPIANEPESGRLRKNEARVLLVDGNAEMRDNLERLLGEYWNVDTATDGKAALGHAVRDPPDLVVIEVEVPGLDGFELSRRLRANPRTREVPIIVLCAGPGQDDECKSAEAGADEHLSTLVSPGEVISRVAAHLERPRHRRQDAAADAEQGSGDSGHGKRDSDRGTDDFLAMLGHELRNPLAAIRSATDVIALVGPQDERLQRAGAVLDRQTAHMSHLIDSLLDVSRIARGKICLNRETIDGRSVVQGAVQDRTPEIRAHGLELALDLPAAPVWIHVDKIRLAQILDNLIGNAIKFTDAGDSIRVALRRDHGRAVISVCDTGIGMRPEVIESLFEPFQQEQQGLARSAGGLGLGLSLARALAELHDGHIDAHSAGPGTGAQLRLELPLAPGPADGGPSLGIASPPA